MAAERERFYPQGDDKGSFEPESRCEHCGFDVREHEWVDLDSNGIVFNCSMPFGISPYAGY